MTDAERDKLLIELTSAIAVLLGAVRHGVASRLADMEALEDAQRRLQRLVDVNSATAGP